MATELLSRPGDLPAAAAPVPRNLGLALNDGFSQGLFIAGVVTLVGFLVAIVTTWTPGRVRLNSAMYENGTQPCDEALGTCEAVSS